MVMLCQCWTLTGARFDASEKTTSTYRTMNGQTNRKIERHYLADIIGLLEHSKQSPQQLANKLDFGWQTVAGRLHAKGGKWVPHELDDDDHCSSASRKSLICIGSRPRTRTRNARNRRYYPVSNPHRSQDPITPTRRLEGSSYERWYTRNRCDPARCSQLDTIGSNFSTWTMRSLKKCLDNQQSTHWLWWKTAFPTLIVFTSTLLPESCSLRLPLGFADGARPFAPIFRLVDEVEE